MASKTEDKKLALKYSYFLQKNRHRKDMGPLPSSIHSLKRGLRCVAWCSAGVQAGQCPSRSLMGWDGTRWDGMRHPGKGSDPKAQDSGASSQEVGAQSGEKEGLHRPGCPPTVIDGRHERSSLSSLAGGGGKDSWPCTQRRRWRAAEGTGVSLRDAPGTLSPF